MLNSMQGNHFIDNSETNAARRAHHKLFCAVQSTLNKEFF